MWKLNVSDVALLWKLLRNVKIPSNSYSKLGICHAEAKIILLKPARLHTVTVSTETPLKYSSQPSLFGSIEQRRFRRKAFKLKKEMELRANKKAAMEPTEAGSDDEEDDDDDDEGSDYDEEYLDADGPDAKMPEGYKDAMVTMNSLRCDSVLSTGLGLPRMKVEEAFYANKIMVNGKNITKKSHTVQEGDIVDLVLNKANDKLTVQRVIVRKVFDALTANLWHKVEVRRWKAGIEVDDER